jgi:hypothetical protein
MTQRHAEQNKNVPLVIAKVRNHLGDDSEEKAT